MADGSQPCTLIAKPNPFDADTVFAQVQAGQTIAEMLGAQASHALAVTVGGYPVPREWWGKLRPKAGTLIHVTVYPQGGGGGKFLRSVLMIAVMVAAVAVTGGAAAGLLGAAGFASGTMGAALLGAAVGIVGSLVINALIPPPTPKLGGAQDPFSQLQSITGTSNAANPYGAIPCVVGTMRYFPPHAALPYTEISGDDQYLRMLLDLGYGDLDVSDIQIGGTPIDSYQDVEYQISTNPSLFSQDIYELAVGTALNTASDTTTRTTQGSTTEISLDLVGAQGVFGVNAKGGSVTGTIGFTVQYRAVGAGSWTPIASASGLTLTAGLASTGGAGISLTSGARKTYRGGMRWKVPVGTYDVMVTRTTAKGIGFPGAVDTDSVSDQITWTVLRSISPQNPSTTGTLKLAVRIKATGQINGVVQNLSVLASQKVPRWDGTTWLTPVASNNPAWLYAWLLTRCPAVQRRLADARLDLAGIAAWAAECDAKGLVCSFVMDSARALADVVKDVLAAGRATFGMVNGKYGAVRDIAQAGPVQMFTPANSSGFNYARVFSDLPHALRVKFTNPEANYQQDERLVYADGYSAGNATRFEQLDLRMVTDPDAAWRLGRYHLAVAYNRPTTYTLTADAEHMVCERGDLVHVAHDLTEWGQAWGRITAIAGNVVTLDGPVDLQAGQSYQFRVRRSDGSQADFVVSTPAGDGYQSITLATGLTIGNPGDLFVLGTVAHATAPLLVKTVEPSDDLTAKLTLVDAAPAVLDADAGTPPTFISSITGQSWCAAPDPPTVTIRAGNSAPDDAGVVQPSPGISTPPSGGIARIPIGGGSGGGNSRIRIQAL